MSTTTLGLHIHKVLRNAGLTILPILIALGPLNSKLLGAAWLMFCILGFYIAFKNRGASPHANTIACIAASIWFISCSIALVLASISLLIWQEWSSILNAHLRISMASAAALYLLRQCPLSFRVRTTLIHAIACACILAFAWTALLAFRNTDDSLRTSLASNAIAWAVAMSFYICLLLPAALSAQATNLHRRLWLLSVACGLAAILLSQSRGAFLIIPWCLFVYAWFWHRENSRHHSFYRTLVMLAATVAVVLTMAWFVPGDALRMHQATQDIDEVQASDNYNTSVGARLYLWHLAYDGIRSSPWIGIGGAERLRRIKHAGENESREQAARLQAVRALGHVHNEYLHAALDGGVIGLASFLALLFGMAIAIRYLARISLVAAWQLGGVFFMHATASLSNVNFAHNYYATALALAVVMPLLTAQHDTSQMEHV